MGGVPESLRCPDCGSELLSEPGIPGLCPQCLLSLALKDSPAGAEVAAEASSDPDELATLDRLTAGRILGERYQIRELLGRGGMGEVFRAFDLKLRVDVALKAVRADRVEGARAREQLRQEVRSAREVVSPNVCRIFDLVAEDGQELVSMEFVDGETLSQTLKTRGPLGLQEAREVASQFLSGLEAIHQAGLVHRDFKPENVMLTRAGRVVVMDFGLAKARTEGPTGTISGTPGYMAPEQTRGDPVDARADVFAAGVVLAEMLSVGGTGSHEARQELWRAVRETPPRVPEGPWAAVLRQALSPNPDERHASARSLARALEEVTQRLPGFETKRPYPGLSSFTEEDAEYFFGRELEVEAFWKKLKRPRLLMLVAPSGAGKSSFLRAGLIPTLPKGWKALVTTPGPRPFQALARALVPVFAGDTQATEALLRFEDEDTAVSLLQRFRQRHEHALVVIDQFEELFTLNPPEVQETFARLLGRLVLEADLHVILSLRDDFLLRCRDHEPLVPAFSDLTPLGALDESALRRALVQPALACGYRFEDEALVDEMVAEVRKERGALPLLAFAASRLWERRDHERGLLTRQAYREIGGVAGALAQHAEATLERIGTHRASLVRELLRNLVTAQGTRAVRAREELLSVFAGEAATRAEAEQVLNALVDARLLTSYERAGEAGDSQQQVEIVHESLLTAWPRLVRWQTQDADGAQLRDQLRQAAQLWQDRGKPDDMLWSGTAFQDFALWRQRHPAPLTASESDFAQAMEANATRRRRRRRALGATVVGLAAAVAVVTSLLWQRSEASLRRAEAETRRAEASKLLALGQLELETYPTAALAYALKSLELADTDFGRLFALRALQRGPMAMLTPVRPPGPPAVRFGSVAFSPNGEWLAFGGFQKVLVLNRDGRSPLVLGDYEEAGAGNVRVGFGPRSDVLVGNQRGELRVWSIPEGRELRRGQVDRGTSILVMADDGFLTLTRVAEGRLVRRWPLGQGAPRLIGTIEAGPFDVARETFAAVRGRKLLLRSLESWSVPSRALAETPDEILDVALSASADRLAASGDSGAIRIWPTATRSATPLRVLRSNDTNGLLFDAAGTRLAGLAAGEGGHVTARLWDLAAPPGAEPVVMQRTGPFSNPGTLAFDPTGRWLVATYGPDAALWPLAVPHALVLAGHQGAVLDLAFTPDGKWLVSTAHDGTVRAWPLSPETAAESRIVLRRRLFWPQLAVDSASRHVVVTDGVGHALVAPLLGGALRELDGLPTDVGACVALGDGGRLVATAPVGGRPEQRFVRVWDLETGALRVLPPVPAALAGPTPYFFIRFLGPDRLLASVGGQEMLLYDLAHGTSRVVSGPGGPFAVSHDERLGVGISVSPAVTVGRAKELIRFSLDGRAPITLRSHGGQVSAVALDATDRFVATGSLDGTVRIGPVTGEEPHVFLGHEGQVWAAAFSPDGRWVASGGDDRTIRLWPLPDMSRSPLHTRPYEELLAVLRSHTNVRVVPAPESATGWQLGRDPFSGWARLPER